MEKARKIRYIILGILIVLVIILAIRDFSPLLGSPREPSAILKVTDVSSSVSEQDGICISKITGIITNSGDASAVHVLLTCKGQEKEVTKEIAFISPVKPYSFEITAESDCSKQAKYVCSATCDNCS